MKRIERIVGRMLLVGVLLAGMATSRPAQACGPFFDPSLLQDRGAVLGGVRWGDNNAELARLLPQQNKNSCKCKLELCTTMPKRPDLVDGRLYELGAQAFAAEDLETAQKHFEAVLALPPAQQKHYAVAAAFMLGRLAAVGGEAQFAKARTLVTQGLDDPLCLATESLGELGRQALADHREVEAFHYYVKQYQEGGPSAAASLRVFAQLVQANDTLLRTVMRDPLLQQVLAASAYVARGETWDAEIWSQSNMAHMLQILAELPEVKGADRLAAAAWLAGQFAVAEQFAPKSASGLGLMMQAKVALRHGESARVPALLASSARAAEAENDLRTRDAARQDLLALALGDERWSEAAQLAIQIGDRGVLAHLLDQVLDVDAAIALLNSREMQALPQVPRPTPTDEQLASQPAQARDDWSTLYRDAPGSQSEWRHLIGRRLLRLGRGVAAEAYFPAKLRPQVHGYIKALQQAEKLDGIDKAQALYRAANLVHPDGMDLLGTELEPDWACVGGSYPTGYGMVIRAPQAENENASLFEGPRIQGCAMYRDESQATAALAGPCLMTVDEQLRTHQALPQVGDVRFHYRVVKSQLLEEAADLVPKHTQAFAALLCAAEQPIHYRDDARTHHLYHRYKIEGALVAGLFQGKCPEPEFERARQTPAPSLLWRTLRPVQREVRNWVNTIDLMSAPRR